MPLITVCSGIFIKHCTREFWSPLAVLRISILVSANFGLYWEIELPRLPIDLFESMSIDVLVRIRHIGGGTQEVEFRLARMSTEEGSKRM